ncbi:MAG TPA: hypothetical protein VN780_12145 [Candidatus Eisenbacteria bacterium]|jgi:hypothetical protein|nr:hypothetical protein [Candidatus Eisenbacteria bacterium]
MATKQKAGAVGVMDPRKARKKRASVTEPSGAALTINQAHRWMGKEVITRQALYLAAERGDFPSIRLGRRILIPKQAFQDFLLGVRPSKESAA